MAKQLKHIARIAGLILALLIASLLVPGTVTLIPAFLLLRDIGTIPGVGQYLGLGTYSAIWLPALAHAWAILPEHGRPTFA